MRDFTYRPIDSRLLVDDTDDFDFVTADDHDHELVFRALDRNQRTDIWFSNVEEENADTKIWDPDSDDDGLTDGQEVYWVTSADRSNPYEEIRVEDVNQQGFLDFEKRLGTDPNDPDTDDDCYWDGWIGVYDVDRTDNVVLYMEHLVDDDDGDGRTDDDGVQGDEIVQGQIKTHAVSDAPSPFGADADGDGTDEHSHLHLGELFWETDPTDDSDEETPSPSMTFEVDYYAGADSALNDSSWLRSIENNYAIYGIDVEMQRDEVLNDDDLVHTATLIDDQGDPVTVETFNWTEPFSQEDLFSIEEQFHDTDAGQYMFVASVADTDIGTTQTGVLRYVELPLVGVKLQSVTSIFTKSHQSELGKTSRLQLSRDERIRAVTAKTAVHEVGHVIRVGEEDDRNGKEVYSGCSGCTPKDLTIEEVINPDTDRPVDDWSVMSSGINTDNFISPTDARYTAFSIEEVSALDL